MTKLYLKLQNGVKVMRESDIGHETIALARQLLQVTKEGALNLTTTPQKTRSRNINFQRNEPRKMFEVKNEEKKY